MLYPDKNDLPQSGAEKPEANECDCVNTTPECNGAAPTSEYNGAATSECNGAGNGSGETEAPKKLTLRERFASLLSRAKEAGFARKPFLISLYVFLASLVVYIVARISPEFAEFWSRYPGGAIRFLLSQITTWFHFSLIEWVIVSLPVLITVTLIVVYHKVGKAENLRDSYKPVMPLIYTVFIMISLFFTSFGTCYFRYPLEQNLEIDKQKVSAQELYDTAVIVADEMTGLLDEVDFVYGGRSVMPYSYDELVVKMNDAMASFCSHEEFILSYRTYPKPIALSEPFTHTHISGVYSFVTGESNININYPDFILPFTMAHEMSHQRGIAAENEANFIAYLVCIESDDPYIRYSAYANMYNYFTSALSSADEELYNEFMSSYYPKRFYGELVSYSQMFAKYSQSFASQVSGSINDAFLSSQGQKDGIASYGLVVDLAVAYYKSAR